MSGPLQNGGSADGMVLDFSDLKDMLCELHDMWDHGLILEKTDPLVSFLSENIKGIEPQVERLSYRLGFGKLYLLEAAPTAENLAAYAFGYISGALYAKYGASVRLESVTFFETPTSSATIKQA